LRNFPSKMNEKDIETFLDKELGGIGKIVSKGVYKDKNTQKFYAFVAYEKDESALKAI
jgi:hypothetical protein